MNSISICLLALAMLGWSSAAAAQPLPPAPVPVIYCTDLFHPHDDLDDHFDLACLYALAELDIKAVVLDDFKGKSEQAKRPGRIPVGQLNALTGRNVPWAVGCPVALANPEDPGADAADESRDGVKLILATLKATPCPVSMIAVGSMRNLAAAFNREPALFREKVARLFLFIGDAKGSFREWNVGLDKNAYVRIMNSGLPVYWVPCFDGGLWKNGGDASFWQAGHAELLRDTAAPLFNYFRYAIIQKDATKAPLAYLHEPIPDEERRLVLSQRRNLWCSSVFAYVAGRRFVKRDDDCLTVPASELRPGDKPHEVFSFLPVSVHVEPETGRELLEESARAHQVMRFHVLDQATYARDMTSCTRHLYDELSRRSGSSK